MHKVSEALVTIKNRLDTCKTRVGGHPRLAIKQNYQKNGFKASHKIRCIK
jgi:hypothetical protein